MHLLQHAEERAEGTRKVSIALAADATRRSNASAFCFAPDAPCLSLVVGESSLAKALHVAYAVHEYCSDAVPPQLAWLEAGFYAARGECPGNARPAGLCAVAAPKVPRTCATTRCAATLTPIYASDHPVPPVWVV